MVEHVLFKSKLDVKSCLRGIDRESQGPGLDHGRPRPDPPASSILKRKRGGATLTIFVKPGSGGSKVQMFTEGLSWEGQ